LLLWLELLPPRKLLPLCGGDERDKLLWWWWFGAALLDDVVAVVVVARAKLVDETDSIESDILRDGNNRQDLVKIFPSPQQLRLTASNVLPSTPVYLSLSLVCPKNLTVCTAHTPNPTREVQQ
jgi:hypothetical protein